MPLLRGYFLLLFSCSSESTVQPNPQTVFPVTVATVARKGVPVKIQAIGNVEAYSVVSVKSQVGVC